MTNRDIKYQLIELKRHMFKAQEILNNLLDAQFYPKPMGRKKPPLPSRSQKVERELWLVWRHLKAMGQFTVNDAHKIITKINDDRPPRPVSSYSAILSRWATLGYLQIIEKGIGRRPARYKILDKLPPSISNTG